MIVFSEFSPGLPPSSSTADLRKATEAAKLTGCEMYFIPQDFEQCETAENALAHVLVQEQETPAVWIGYIPDPNRYAAIYTAALVKNIRLLNSPEQHLTAQEFDRAYPRLMGLTPESVIITSEKDCADAAAQLVCPCSSKEPCSRGSLGDGKRASLKQRRNCVCFAAICWNWTTGHGAELL